MWAFVVGARELCEPGLNGVMDAAPANLVAFVEDHKRCGLLRGGHQGVLCQLAPCCVLAAFHGPSG